MSESELLKHVATELERLQIPFMLTGSLVSSLQGHPRSTHDIDLVVDLPADKTDALFAAFPPPAFYLSREAMDEALRNRGMFNLLEISSGDKADFWLLTDEQFDRSRFARRQFVDFDGFQVAVSSPADTILMKLKWSRDAGGSEKQHLDALHVYEIQYARLDVPYIEHWVAQLDLHELWERVKRDASPIR